MSGSRHSPSLPGVGPPTDRAVRSFSAWRITGYAYSVVLPWVATDLGFHLDPLRGMRLALTFAACASTAAFFGLGQAVLATAVSAVAFNYYVEPLQRPATTMVEMLVRTVAILIVGFLLALLTRQRGAAEKKLRVAVGNLQEQAEALMQAQQASRSAAWTFDSRTREMRWYPGAAEIFGRPHAEIMAMGSPNELAFEEDRALIAEAAERTERTGAAFVAEFRVQWPNGETHWLEARGIPLPSAPLIWRGATIDITDRKQAEAALVRTEKLAVAGRLAASIAHEINNPLEAVTNLCYLARQTAEDGETRSYIELAESELGRVAQITSQTLRFHRQQTAAAETDLGEMLRSIVTLYERKLSQTGIAVRLEAEPVAPLACYAGEMRQVLANLVGNAADAMAEGGTLRLRVHPSIDWRTGSAAVRITIADTGHGMAPETQKRIYEPFYTTKGDVGTGLGLWVTAGIVEKHHGSLRMRSSVEEGRSGTVFTLLLPYMSAREEDPVG